MLALQLTGWAAVLFAQNYSFTYVSRARNSGSLLRHAKAAVFSNAIWIFSQILMLGPMFDSLTGKHGLHQQIIAGAIYTVATVAGSIAAHVVAKKTEKGSSAVGASALYAQITKSEWEATKQQLEELKNLPTVAEFTRVKGLAEQAHDLAIGVIPDSGIRANIFNGGAVTK